MTNVVHWRPVWTFLVVLSLFVRVCVCAECFKGSLSVFLKGVSRVFYGCFTSVLRLFQGCFQDVLHVF